MFALVAIFIYLMYNYIILYIHVRTCVYIQHSGIVHVIVLNNKLFYLRLRGTTSSNSHSKTTGEQPRVAKSFTTGVIRSYSDST